MNCPEARIAMRALIESDSPLDAQTRAHVATCEDCSEDHGDWVLDHALGQQRAPLPADDFVDRVIEYAVRNAAAKRQQRFAIAASIAVVGMILGIFESNRQMPAVGPLAVAQVTLTAHEGKTVRLVIDSPAQHDAATVTIELADNLELAGFPNERKIQWRTNLSAGKNLLALPLTLTTPSESHFHVALSYGATKQNVRVSVHPASSGELNQVKA